ncbi:hypothetical protein SEA_RANDO14_70 [Mycobacterium phage Rando14]|uniref:Uncharacterized protein n=1 Tax=Mycobacterium phage Rando14 TaxID=2301556 RepID=A0A385D540_9CAUD|nr:hypothetical protein I5G75_gp26 [Mycobacterium phage Rando14]AXQ53090.1 hypothetical protein SEA_RANDO14_70 [Mycobacterium phage Rando14]
MRYRSAGVSCDAADFEGITGGACGRTVELTGGVSFGDVERAAAVEGWCKVGRGATARYLCPKHCAEYNRE